MSTQGEESGAPGLTNRELRSLKARAQKLEPVIKVGRAGVTEGLVTSLDQALARHELVKVKFVEFKEEKDALAAGLAARTGSRLIWRVGHVAVLYRARTGDAANAAGTAVGGVPAGGPPGGKRA